MHGAIPEIVLIGSQAQPHLLDTLPHHDFLPIVKNLLFCHPETTWKVVRRGMKTILHLIEIPLTVHDPTRRREILMNILRTDGILSDQTLKREIRMNILPIEGMLSGQIH